MAFLLHDLNEKVQVTAIEATGLLTNRAAIDQLRDVLDRSRNMKVKRAALTALAQMPDPQLHGVYVTYLDHKDEGLREGAAEGLGRLKNRRGHGYTRARVQQRKQDRASVVRGVRVGESWA